MQKKSRTVAWNEVARPFSGLPTDTEHEISVQREAIPLIFVPGIMGSRLRRAGTNGTGEGADGLPNLRWDATTRHEPTIKWLKKHYLWEGAAHRKNMLVGGLFASNYLEVDNDNPVGDGFRGIIPDYRDFLNDLRNRDWGALGKIFVFPVYAHGYNWTDCNENSGKALAARIQQVMAEARSVAGKCEKVILITHSMGGLVARAASQLAGAAGSILGIVHGVQPATGATAAYWRIKAGFEGDWKASAVLGNEGPDVAAILGNVPGGLELLPTKQHRTNAGGTAWLRITEGGTVLRELPVADPYQEIYEVPAVLRPAAGKGASTNAFWGLIDPALLDPNNAFPTPAAGAGAADAGTGTGATANDDPNALDAATPRVPGSPWAQYRRMLDIAKAFHDKLGLTPHANTFCLRGTGQTTADVIELRGESYWVQGSSYGTREFSAYYRNAEDKNRRAVLQQPAGQGDGTVPLFSAGALNKAGRPPPGDTDVAVTHQPAYEDPAAQAFTLRAITALCKLHYDSVPK